MKALSSFWRAGLVFAWAVGSPWASAGPVVQPGSSYELLLYQANNVGSPARSTFSFDGAAQTFNFAPAPGGLVTVTVQESQTDLGGGRASIDIGLSFTGGDPYPGTTFSGFGLGVGVGTAPGDVLDLTGPVGLSAAVLSGVAGDGSLLSFDLMSEYQRLGSGAPWTGALFGLGRDPFGRVANYFMDMQFGGVGLRQMNLHFETRAFNSVSSSGTTPLLALGLGLGQLVLGLGRRRA